jgi:hypothetical protein
VLLVKVAEVEGPLAVATGADVVGVAVVAGADVAVVSCQQYFQDPTAGSPNVALLQGTAAANVATTNFVVVPYLTLRVPLKEQVSFSSAHWTHVVAADVVVAPCELDAVASVLVAVRSTVPPPPHAATSRPVERICTSARDRDRKYEKVWSFI